MKKHLLELFYKSFETTLSPEEQKLLDQELQSDPALKTVHDEVSDIRLLVNNHGRERFPSTFEAGLARKVNPIFRMRENQGVLPDVFTAAFRKVSISGGIVLLILLLYNLSAGNDNIIKNFLGDSTTTMKFAYDPSEQPMWTDAK
jgi:hypothetical protein